jgi:enoyl-CoA hydratase/carnithine racemase
MPGFMPGIHALAETKGVDGRDKPGHDNREVSAMSQAAVATPQAEKMLSRKEGSVGYVIFNNPERHNAVSLDMWKTAGEMLDDFRSDNNIKVVVVTGAGGKAFVSGADISRFEKERSNEEAVRHYNSAVDKSYRAFHEFPKPTIAMIRGYCIGGGMGLATCCDLRIATEKSTFAVPAAKLGLGYGYSGLKRLVDVVGPSFAMEIFYTARQFTAAEALTMGLVNRVVPDGELESYVNNYAATIAGNAPLTIKAVKAVVSEMMKDESKRDLNRAQAAVEACFMSRDYEEGRKAFMEKRKPVFTGS